MSRLTALVRPVSMAAALALVAGGIALACAAATATPTTPAQPQPSPTPIRSTSTTLTVYSGRSESLVGPIIKQFEQASGTKVNVKYAGTTDLAATLKEEGRNSPTDVFFAQDAGALGAVSDMLAPMPQDVLSQVDPRYSARNGRWVGVSGRVRVIAYSTTRVKESDLPASVLDLTDPKWKGRVGWAPTNGSFHIFVTALRVAKGEDAARRWLEGMKANGAKAYSGNTQIVQAIADGEVDLGLPNHYYLYGFLRERGESFPVRNYYPKNGDIGSLVNVAGVGILETSRNKEAAQRFVSFMLSPVAQQYFASQTYEYPLVSGVRTHEMLKPLSEVQPPDVDLNNLGDLEGTLKLLRETGVLP